MMVEPAAATCYPPSRQRQRCVMMKMTRITGVGILLLATAACLAGYVLYVGKRRDPESHRSMTYHRYCQNNYHNFIPGLQVYAELHTNMCPPSLEAFRTEVLGVASDSRAMYCPLARARGKVGRFVYVGNGVKWIGGHGIQATDYAPETIDRYYPTFTNLVPILFDYPDNHPEGGYVLYNSGLTVMFRRKTDWVAFLDGHLSGELVLQENDLRWWQWAPGKPF